jgi:hypothetical protein
MHARPYSTKQCILPNCAARVLDEDAQQIEGLWPKWDLGILRIAQAAAPEVQGEARKA